jgi:hypothetical protein
VVERVEGMGSVVGGKLGIKLGGVMGSACSPDSKRTTIHQLKGGRAWVTCTKGNMVLWIYLGIKRVLKTCILPVNFALDLTISLSRELRQMAGLTSAVL